MNGCVFSIKMHEGSKCEMDYIHQMGDISHAELNNGEACFSHGIKNCNSVFDFLPHDCEFMLYFTTQKAHELSILTHVLTVLSNTLANNSNNTEL